MADLDKMLRFDPLAAAEELTGVSYKGSAMTMALGMLMALDHSERKRSELQKASDSHHGMSFADFISLATDEGFVTVHAHNFIPTPYRDELPVQECYMILWHPEGFLLTVESYRGTSMNAGKLYYNLNFGPEIPKGYYNYTSSGGFYRHSFDEEGKLKGDAIWAGYHDIREGFRHTLRKLRTQNPMPVWKKQPFLWLVNYAETKVPGYDYKAIAASRIATFPEEVQKAIAGE